MSQQQTSDTYSSGDEYVGAQINQLMFRRKITRRELGEVLQTAGPVVSRKLRGESTWTIDELLVVSRYLEVDLVDLMPPADYNPVLSGRGRGRAIPSTGEYVTNRRADLNPVGEARVIPFRRRCGWFVDVGRLVPYPFPVRPEPGEQVEHDTAAVVIPIGRAS